MRIALVVLMAWSLSAAEVRLSPEQRLLSGTAASQRNVQVVQASGHRFAAWRDSERSFAIDGSFDDTPMSFARSDSRTMSAPAVAAGTHTFFVAWSELAPYDGQIRARRVASNGDILDKTPLELCRGNTFGPGLMFDGTAYVVTCSARDVVTGVLQTRVLRVTESGSVTDDLPPLQAFEDTRPLRTSDGPRFAGAHYPITCVPICYPYAMTYVYGSNDAVKQIGLSSGNMTWSAAAAPDGVVVAMFGSFHYRGIFLGRTSLDGVVVRPSFRPTELADAVSGSGTILWNGSEYVLAWSELVSGSWRIRGIRLDRSGELIDLAPFVIAESGTTTDAPSLFVTESGVLIGYSRWEDSTRTATAFTRTLDRLPATPSRRRSTRH